LRRQELHNEVLINICRCAADYIWLTFGTHHYVAAHGVRDIVSRLTSPIPVENIHLDAEVREVASSSTETATASVSFGSAWTNNSKTETISGFSHIILATPTRHSARLVESFASSLPTNSTLRGPLGKVVQQLNTFCTRKVTVITHRDETVLPNHRSDWRDLNLVMEPSGPSISEKPSSTTQSTSGGVMATHIFPTPSGPPLCQTTNPIVSPLPQTILSQSILDRSVLSIESKGARDSFCKSLDDGEFRWTRGDLQGLKASSNEQAEAKIWACGAWAYGGIPLLEGCVGSAEIVVDAILEEEGIEAMRVI
jgi:hypothetical protein